MTEQKLAQELDEQAMLFALGILDPEDCQAFRAKLQGESDHARQTAAAYQTTVEALASAVVPMAPSPALRERLVQRMVLESAREGHAFERTADVVALGAAPITPPSSLRERLLSRIEQSVDARTGIKDAMSIRTEPAVSIQDGRMGSRGLVSVQEVPASPDDQHSEVVGVKPGTWLQSCWQSFVSFIRMAPIRIVTSRIVQQSSKGLTFVNASEGLWLDLASGVRAKVLSFDPVSKRTTTLLRFAPGTSYAPHRHTTVEELYVLEGGCSIAGHEMRVGDYHRAEAGTEHHDTSSDDGCLLLVISSPQNELL